MVARRGECVNPWSYSNTWQKTHGLIRTIRGRQTERVARPLLIGMRDHRVSAARLSAAVVKYRWTVSERAKPPADCDSFPDGNQPLSDRVANQFRLVLQPEFAHQAGAMVLDRAGADVQTAGNFRACVSLRSKLQDLTLPHRQRFMRIKGPRLGL